MFSWMLEVFCVKDVFSITPRPQCFLSNHVGSPQHFRYLTEYKGVKLMLFVYLV